MHWTLWTMLVSIIILVIEFLVLRCFQVKKYKDRDWKNVEFPVFVIFILILMALIPVMNCIAIVAFPIITIENLEDNYNYMQMKPIEGNENNVMLRILHFLSKSI